MPPVLGHELGDDDGHEGLGIARKSARLQYLKERWANRVKGIPRVRFYSSLDPSESCAIATVGIEGLDMTKLADHLIDKHGIVVSSIKHPDFEGIRVVPNVSLSLQEIDYFGDVLEDIARTCELK